MGFVALANLVAVAVVADFAFHAEHAAFVTLLDRLAITEREPDQHHDERLQKPMHGSTKTRREKVVEE